MAKLILIGCGKAKQAEGWARVINCSGTNSTGAEWMSEIKVKPTSQPADWWEAFAKQAKQEGMSLSAWIGLACLKALPVSDETNWSVESVLQTHGLSPRPKKGPRKACTKEAGK